MNNIKVEILGDLAEELMIKGAIVGMYAVSYGISGPGWLCKGLGEGLLIVGRSLRTVAGNVEYPSKKSGVRKESMRSACKDTSEDLEVPRTKITASDAVGKVSFPSGKVVTPMPKETEETSESCASTTQQVEKESDPSKTKAPTESHKEGSIPRPADAGSP